MTTVPAELDEDDPGDSRARVSRYLEYAAAAPSGSRAQFMNLGLMVERGRK